MKKTFDRETLDELDIPWDCLDQQIEEEGHWTLKKTGVAEINGQYWRFHWEEGSTEMQEDTDPWFDDGEVEGTLVELQQVTVSKWVAV